MSTLSTLLRLEPLGFSVHPGGGSLPFWCLHEAYNCRVREALGWVAVNWQVRATLSTLFFAVFRKLQWQQCAGQRIAESMGGAFQIPHACAVFNVASTASWSRSETDIRVGVIISEPVIVQPLIWPVMG